MEQASKSGSGKYNARYLLCDCSGQSELEAADTEVVCSPVQCLHRAVDGTPGIIAIRFGESLIREREALVELCGVLKRNSHTREIMVVALLYSKHRIVVESLKRAGVDYVKLIGNTAVTSICLREIIDALGSGDRIERELERLCPYLHYSPVDAHRELTVCGGYLDRMVLGGSWLHEVCETEDHLRCEYFLNPRIKK